MRYRWSDPDAQGSTACRQLQQQRARAQAQSGKLEYWPQRAPANDSQAARAAAPLYNPDACYTSLSLRLFPKAADSICDPRRRIAHRNHPLTPLLPPPSLAAHTAVANLHSRSHRAITIPLCRCSRSPAPINRYILVSLSIWAAFSTCRFPTIHLARQLEPLAGSRGRILLTHESISNPACPWTWAWWRRESSLAFVIWRRVEAFAFPRSHPSTPAPVLSKHSTLSIPAPLPHMREYP